MAKQIKVSLRETVKVQDSGVKRKTSKPDMIQQLNGGQK